MLHLRPHRRLAPLRRRRRPLLVQQPALAGFHRDLPLHRRVPVLLARAHPLVARVAPYALLAPVQQRVRRGHVRGVRRRRLQAVRQPRLRGHTDMRLHPEGPPIALLRLAHLRVPCARAVLRRRRRGDDARVHDRPSLQPMPERGQVRVDLLEQRLAQSVLLQQVAEVQDRRLVGQRSRQPQPDKAPHRLHLIQQVLHAGVAQVVEQLHTVHAQHHRKRVWPATATGLRIERLDARLQPAPRDQRVHLPEEYLAPRPALLRVVLQLRKARLFHRSPAVS